MSRLGPRLSNLFFYLGFGAFVGLMLVGLVIEGRAYLADFWGHTRLLLLALLLIGGVLLAGIALLVLKDALLGWLGSWLRRQPDTPAPEWVCTYSECQRWFFPGELTGPNLPPAPEAKNSWQYRAPGCQSRGSQDGEPCCHLVRLADLLTRYSPEQLAAYIHAIRREGATFPAIPLNLPPVEILELVQRRQLPVEPMEKK